MEIADERAHLGLAYIASTAAHGHRLTPDEFEAFMKRPQRQRKTSIPIATAFTSQMITGLFQETGVDESFTDYFLRLRWIVGRNDATLALTRLGSAVLAALDEGDPGGFVSVVALEPGDTMAYPLALAQLAQVSDAALMVDAYLRFEGFAHLLQFTGVERVLVGPDADGDAIAAAIATTNENRRIEARLSDELHDRYLIPATGDVIMLGTSLNGIGRRHAAMVTLSGGSADVIRQQYEKVWKRAGVLEGKRATRRKKVPATKRTNKAAQS